MLPQHARRAERHQRVAVDLVAELVDHDEAVGVAVEADADVRVPLLHLTRTELGMERADLVIDVASVRLHADGVRGRSELREDERRDAIGSAVRRVDDDA